MASTYFRNRATQQIATATSTFAQLARLQKKYSTTYFLATAFFPRRIRRDITLLYAFVRIPDEIVDTASSEEEAIADISAWKKYWQLSLQTPEQKDVPWIIKEMKLLCDRHTIPYILVDTFIDAMIQDTQKQRYATYDEVCEYMYGSAAVVGRMITYIVGVTDTTIITKADDLGYAMQLTNFLRDISEDYELRNRIYLPQDELRMYGITEEMIAHKTCTPEWISYMQFCIKRNREYYQKAYYAERLLPWYARTAVWIAHTLYEAQLDSIEAVGYSLHIRTKGNRTLKQKVGLISKKIITSLWHKK